MPLFSKDHFNEDYLSERKNKEKTPLMSNFLSFIEQVFEEN